MDLWFTEKQTENHGITTKVERTLHKEETDFQKLDVIETSEFGKMLVLDGMVMTTDKDEFVYHEMITHVAMNTHPNPKNVLVIGGGDGGVVREVLKYDIDKVTLVEIDGAVIEKSKEYFPSIAGKLVDPKVDIKVSDGYKHIKDNENEYDVIIVDSTEPVGPAVALFEREFYGSIYRSLKEDGIMVAQTDTPWFKADFIRRVFKDIKSIFPITHLYTASIPTYPSGLWSFTIGSKKYDPVSTPLNNLRDINGKYYSKEMHKGLFNLPPFIKELTKEGN